MKRTIAVLTGLLMSIFMSCPVLASDEPILDGDKPLVVMLFDKHCKKWCAEVRPILSEVRSAYGDKIAYYELDLTEGEKLKESSVLAKRLGIHGFVTSSLDWVPMVGVFTRKRKPTVDAPGVKKKVVYLEGVERALKEK